MSEMKRNAELQKEIDELQKEIERIESRLEACTDVAALQGIELDDAEAVIARYETLYGKLK